MPDVPKLLHIKGEPRRRERRWPVYVIFQIRRRYEGGVLRIRVWLDESGNGAAELDQR